VEAVVEGNDFVAVFAGCVFVQLAPFARQFDCAFICFGTAVGEEDAIKARVVGQQLGQLDRWFVVESWRWVDELFRLCSEGVLNWFSPKATACG